MDENDICEINDKMNLSLNSGLYMKKYD